MAKDLQKMTDNVAGEAKIKVERFDSTPLSFRQVSNYGDAWKYGNNLGTSMARQISLGKDKDNLGLDLGDLTSSLRPRV